MYQVVLRQKQALIRLCSILVVIGFASAGFAADWPQLGRDPQRTNFTPEPVGKYAPSVSGWQNMWTWTSPGGSPLAIRTQIVSAEGVVAFGTWDGKMHCLDFASGVERWRFLSNGPILHSAAIGNGKVFFGSADGRVYAVDHMTGTLVWAVKTGKGIVAAPLLVNGNIYIGSKDGVFYALNGNTGAKLWTRNIGEPIVTAAAYSATTHRIFFGTDRVKAYALNFTDGTVAWSRQLYGQSMQEAWPQVADNHSVVIFRVLSIYDMWNNINWAGRYDMANIGGTSRENEMDIISNKLQAEPHRRTFYALKLSDGTDRYAKPVPVCYSWGISSTMHAQAIDYVNNRCWTMWRTMFEPTRDTVDTGNLNLSTGRFETHVQWGCVNSWGLVMTGIPADEPRPLSATPDTWFTCQSFGPSGSYVPTGQSFTTVMSGGWMEFHDRHSDLNWAGMWPNAWNRGLVAPIWTNGRLLWNGHGGVGCVRPK